MISGWLPRPELFGVTRSTGTYMRLDNFDRMAGELSAFRDAGGAAVVEVTCDGWGRDVEVLARLSAASGVHVVATAGFYIEPCMPTFVAEWSVERLADHLIRIPGVDLGDETTTDPPAPVRG